MSSFNTSAALGREDFVRPQILRSEIVAAARLWLGTPYRHQASLRGVGADCLGLLRGLWRDLYGQEPELPPPYAPDWAEMSTSEPLLEAAQRYLVALPDGVIREGSILIFRWREGVAAKHCGVASADHHFIHAHDGASVAEVALVPAWEKRIVGVFDFPQVLEG